VEGRNPVKRVVLSTKVIEDVRKWVPLCNVYRSVYSFDRLAPNGRPDWNSAKLDVLYLDVDLLDSEGVYHDEDLPARIAEWLNKENYRRCYMFTGGGYHVLVDVENATKERIYTAHYYLRCDLGFPLDKSAIDIERGVRIIPSYNFNKRAYTSYATEADFINSFIVVHDRFSKLCNTSKIPIYYGDNKWNLGSVTATASPHKGCDPGPIAMAREDATFNDIEREYGKICDTLISLARQDHVSHQERFFIILYMKDIMRVPYSDFTRVYKAIIGNGRDFEHSLGEQQARYGYMYDTHFNPTIFKMYGLCREDCNECLEQKAEYDKLLDGLFL